MNRYIIALSLAGIFSCAYAHGANFRLEWDHAKTKIIERAQGFINNESPDCFGGLGIDQDILNNESLDYLGGLGIDIAKNILSADKEWCIAEEVFSEIEEQEVYKKAVENPKDDILWKQLENGVWKLILARTGGDTVMCSYPRVRVKDICFSYLELLREKLMVQHTVKHRFEKCT